MKDFFNQNLSKLEIEINELDGEGNPRATPLKKYISHYLADTAHT